MESNLYNPASQPKEWLITNFVARTNVFKKIFKDLLSGNMQYPEQHYLIQGQRGMGKTTLLLRLKYEIENTEQLSKWIIPVFFNEESYDLTSLSNLWEKLLKYLDNLWETGGEYYGKTDEFVGNTDYEKNCFDLLICILKNNKKKLVIFFDNFGQLFLDNLKEKEQHRLREILMNCNDIRIIGASAVVLQDLHDYSKPFFEFFRIINLEGLDKNETLQLISKLNENSDSKIDIKKSKAKIETLAILTGGVIRTIMLIYEVILADKDGTALSDLEIILDRITPLYKHRIEDLPVQQRKIIDVIAKKWDAISTKEIAENIRDDGKPMATKLISAQLQQLERNNVIEKKQTNTKNHLYQLKERFFNIWYLMRNGDRFDRCRVMWLTKFLETWYNDNSDIENFIQRHIELLRSGKYYPNSAILIAEALSYSAKVNIESQGNLIEATKAILNEEQKKLLPIFSIIQFNAAMKLYEAGQYAKSIKILETVDQISDKANTLLFTCYLKSNEYERAINSLSSNNQFKPYLTALAFIKMLDYDTAIEYLEESSRLDIKRKLPPGTINFLIGGIYYTGKNDFKQALKYYELAINEGNTLVYNNIIDLCVENKKFEIAEKYFIQAIDMNERSIGKNLIDEYIINLNKNERALELLDYGKKLNSSDGDYPFYEALIYYFDKEYQNAESLLIKALKKFEKEKNHNLNYNMIFLLLGSIYILQKNKVKALKIANEKTHLIIGVEYIEKSIIYIWHNQFNKAFDLIDQYTKNTSSLDSLNTERLEFLILLLISKQQYHFTKSLFDSQSLNLKDKFKPIYYALIESLKNEFPNEYLKMGAELQQPVIDIMKRIKKMAEEYA